MKTHPVLLLVILMMAVYGSINVRAGMSDDIASANNALMAGNAAAALTEYQQILDSPEFAKFSSPQLWYNRGLAEEKTGDMPAAALSFRRALLLDPTLAVARNALASTLGTLGAPASIAPGWRDQMLERIHPKLLIVGGAIVGWSGVFLLVVFVMQKKRKASLIALALVAVIIGHGGTLLGSLIDPRRLAAAEAVVMAKNAPTLRATPADSATSLGTLSPGSLITILSRNGMWWYVADGSGQTGWIPSTTVTPLLPGSAGS